MRMEVSPETALNRLQEREVQMQDSHGRPRQNDLANDRCLDEQRAFEQGRTPPDNYSHDARASFTEGAFFVSVVR